jgi:hypothetical protein
MKPVPMRMFDPVQLQTRDAMLRDSEPLEADDDDERDGGGVLSETALRCLQEIFSKYVGGNTRTTAVGVTTSDALSKRLAEHAHNRAVADGYAKFWAGKNAEFAASVRR